MYRKRLLLPLSIAMILAILLLLLFQAESGVVSHFVAHPTSASFLPEGKCAFDLSVPYEKNKLLRDVLLNGTLPSMFCPAPMRKTRGQCLPSEILLTVFFPKEQQMPNSSSGEMAPFFVEVGALDGVDGSNTYLLQERGWSGLLIEASQKYYDQLVFNRFRKGTNWRDRRVHVLNRAICASEDLALQDKAAVAFHHHVFGRGGVVKYFSKEYMRKNGMSLESMLASTATTVVECDEVSAAVLRLNRTHIDFWSLDVEGGELAALLAFDWARVTVGVLMIEMDGSDPEREQSIRLLLLHRLKMTFFVRVFDDEIYYNGSTGVKKYGLLRNCRGGGL